MEKPSLSRSINDFDIKAFTKEEKLEEQIKILKEEKKKLQEKYDALVDKIFDSKLKKKVVMTPEQEEIVEMFRMDL
jgi:hypothetical protein